MKTSRSCPIFLLCGLAFFIASVNGGSYLITAPSTMLRGANYDITVDILQSLDGEDVEVEVQLLERVMNQITRRRELVEIKSVSANFSEGTTGILSMEIEDDIDCPGCRLQIRGRGGLQIDQTIYLSISSSLVGVLVQTDKAIYKPGQTVRYRALAVYPSLQLYNGLFNVIIEDPRGNKVQYLTNLTSTGGVVEGSLDLSDQPLFGDWSLRVSLQDVVDSQVQTFTVAQYELPRFEVNVDLAPYGLTNQALLNGKVKAKYTFGKSVEGMVELHVGPNRGPDSCGQLPATVQISFAIDGETSFSIPREDITRALGYLGDGTEVKVTAFVKESATGVRLNGSSVITYHANEYNIKFLDSTPNVFKPGLPYIAFFQVSTPDDMPPTGSVNRIVSVYTTAHYSAKVGDQTLYGVREFTGTYPLPGQNLTLPTSGILPVDIDIPANATKISIKATFGTVSTSKDIENAYSPGNTFLQLTLLGSNIKANEPATFQMKGTEPLGAVNFMVMARGSVVESGSVQGENATTFTFTLPVIHAMAPTAHILAYYAKNNSEIVADSLAFNVEGIFDNEVSVSFSKNESQPGEEVTLTVTADPASTVCVLAVDQSVLLLKSGNDITADKVSEEISKFDSGKKPSDSEFALSYSSKSAKGVFTGVGLAVFSDLNLEAPPPRLYGRRHYSPGYPSYEDSEMLMGAAPGPRGPSPAMSPMPIGSQKPLAEVKRVRQKFPESWLWSTAETGTDGTANFSSAFPDTITSWVASAFATNPTTGLGVTLQPDKARVFQPFFVSLSQPRTVVRREIAVVTATVFNYLPTDVEVVVTLKASDNYTYLPQNGQSASSGDIVVNIQVPSDEQGVVYFPIQATKLGLVPIEVSARTTIAADAVRRDIFVKPEGASVSYNYPVFVKNDAATDVTTETVTLSLPSSVVEGSATSRVKVTGDLIGSSVVSLPSLLTLPTGCGEQSLVKFAPTLNVYRYLQATGQMTNYYKTLLESRLEAGYQRQLTYQRFDGGFSAFGNRDSAGSTWLTAMVVRTFLEAQGTIYIDTDMVERGLNWLVDRQSADGSFKEFGQVLDRSIQGTYNKPTLTAYVLLALMQGRQLFETEQLRACDVRGRRRSLNFDFAICKYVNTTRAAIRYLENEVAEVDDQFSLSVISLALTKANSDAAEGAFLRLQSLGRQEGALEYWADNATESETPPVPPFVRGSAYLPGWRPPRVQARPLDVLISSYVILTYIANDQREQALPVVRWLAMQRNAKGGFVSTQDTTMALEALSKYAANRIILEDRDMTVKVSPEGSEVELEFDVTIENAITLQIQELPRGASSEVNLEVSGEGLAFVEFDVRFNVKEELSTPSFEVNTVLLDDDIDKFNLMICTKWLWDRQTGMVVQEVSIPSGFEPDLKSMEDVAGMKKAERRGDIVEVYFDEITKTSLCYSMMMTRSGKVANTQGNFVRTYDYYSPADQSTVFYQPKKLRDATVCDVCDGCCEN